MLNRPRIDRPTAIVLVACLVAWLPSLGPYIQIADDFPLGALLDHGPIAYATSWIARDGIWRILGRPLIALGIHVHPLFYGALALVTHSVAMVAFLRVCRALLGGSVLPLVLTLTAAVFPWGHGAILFASAYDVVASTALFWIVVLLLWKNRSGPQRMTFVACYLLTLAAALIQELLVFASIASGALLWHSASRPRELMQLVRTRWAGWAPAAAGATYIAIYEWMRPATAWKSPSWNPESVLSVSFYQYSNVFVLEPWLSPITRRVAFDSLDARIVWLGAGLACGLAALLIAAARREPPETVAHQVTGSLIAYATLLMLGASFVYAVAGGFSLDSRKKYPLVLFVLFLAACGWRRFSRIAPSRRVVWGVVVAVVMTGVPTTWLVVALWRYEATRGAALVEYLAANHIAGPIRVAWKPDLYQAWPTASRVWGYRFDDAWLLNVALESRGAKPVQLSSSDSAPLVIVSDDRVSLSPDRGAR